MSGEVPNDQHADGASDGAIAVSKPEFAVFVTAPTCSSHVLNKVLILMRDFEYCDEDEDYLTLVTSRAFLTPPISLAAVPTTISLDATNNSFVGATLHDVYEWMQGEAEHARACDLSSSLFVVIDEVSLNRDPLECIIVERCSDEESESDEEENDEQENDEQENDEQENDEQENDEQENDEEVKPHVENKEKDQDEASKAGQNQPEFRAARLPVEEAWSMLANLNIANMDFEEYVGEAEEPGEDGTYAWVPFPDDPNPDVAELHRVDHEQAARKRLARLAEARRKGWIT